MQIVQPWSPVKKAVVKVVLWGERCRRGTLGVEGGQFGGSVAWQVVEVEWATCAVWCEGMAREGVNNLTSFPFMPPTDYCSPARVTSTPFLSSPCLLFLFANRAPDCSDQPASCMQPPSQSQRHHCSYQRWFRKGGPRPLGQVEEEEAGGGRCAGKQWESPSKRLTAETAPLLSKDALCGWVMLGTKGHAEEYGGQATTSSLGEQMDGRV